MTVESVNIETETETKTETGLFVIVASCEDYIYTSPV